MPPNGEHLRSTPAQRPAGVVTRLRLVGGTRRHHFDRINFKPRKVPENVESPTRRLRAVLGAFLFEAPICYRK
jgi:hypothetical protein